VPPIPPIRSSCLPPHYLVRRRVTRLFLGPIIGLIGVELGENFAEKKVTFWRSPPRSLAASSSERIGRELWIEQKALGLTAEQPKTRFIPIPDLRWTRFFWRQLGKGVFGR
jgi:hypothetical protein